MQLGVMNDSNKSIDERSPMYRETEEYTSNALINQVKTQTAPKHVHIPKFNMDLLQKNNGEEVRKNV